MTRSVISTVAMSAAEYAERYRAALESNALVQGAWNDERDGRHVACALGVLGDSVSSVGDCPAQVMPRWLAQMVPWLFDNMRPEDAFAWGLVFTDQLRRLDGKVPFTVVYDWHANYSCELGIEAAERQGRDKTPHLALKELHRRALNSDRAPREEWFKTLRDAYARAYADADADAYAYAYANANAYADAYAYANANAYADAYAYANAYADADAHQTAIKRLADGLVECLSRVLAEAAQ